MAHGGSAPFLALHSCFFFFYLFLFFLSFCSVLQGAQLSVASDELPIGGNGCIRMHARHSGGEECFNPGNIVAAAVVDSSSVINASANSDDWEKGRFDAWRVCNKIPIDTAIENIPLNEFADMLEKFILCVHRQDGANYSPDSLQNLFRTFNRILRRAQDSRILQTREEEKLIDIYTVLNFFRAKKALEIAMKESASAGGTSNTKEKLSVSGVPIEVGMAITGHRDPNSYKRYDQSGIVATCECVSDGCPAVCSGKAAGLAGRSSVQNPLMDISNVNGSVNLPVEIDDDYRKDLDTVLERSPALKKLFLDCSVDRRFGGNITFQGVAKSLIMRRVLAKGLMRNPSDVFKCHV